MSDESKRRNNNNRKRGARFEKKCADYLEMDVVPYSGSNKRFGYGDIRNDVWLGECKNLKLAERARGDIFVIQQDFLDKLRTRARDAGKYPFLIFMASGKAEKYVMVPFEYTGIMPEYVPVRFDLKIPNKNIVNWNIKYEVLTKYVKDGVFGVITKKMVVRDTFIVEDCVIIMTAKTFKEAVMQHVADNDKSH